MERARAVSATRVRDFYPRRGSGTGQGGRKERERERSPGIKSARIKNASSETSYSRFLPVVGINRPFRRRCINRDRGRRTFLPARSSSARPTPPGVEWLLLFRDHSLRYPAIVDNKTSILAYGCASIVEEVCWVVIYSSARLACNAADPPERRYPGIKSKFTEMQLMCLQYRSLKSRKAHADSVLWSTDEKLYRYFHFSRVLLE